mmetsp:Transcript_85582/g.218206  ORF Transcript_85582/g.218206 Transcript_85582/m.218206 type:complete len:159 (+) Transcript_85582:410-886(+)
MEVATLLRASLDSQIGRQMMTPATTKPQTRLTNTQKKKKPSLKTPMDRHSVGHTTTTNSEKPTPRCTIHLLAPSKLCSSLETPSSGVRIQHLYLAHGLQVVVLRTGDREEEMNQSGREDRCQHRLVLTEGCHCHFAIHRSCHGEPCCNCQNQSAPSTN